MKKREREDDIAPEYDFSTGVRGRFAGRFYVDPATPAGTTVVLRRPFPEHGLTEDDVGRIVGRNDDATLEVEFAFGPEESTVRVTARPGDLRLLGAGEVLHARRSRTG